MNDAPPEAAFGARPADLARAAGDDATHRCDSPTPRPKLSSELLALSRDEGLERISVGDIKQAIGRRSFGALMLIFAFPNLLPSPPGASAVLGAPLVFLSAQLMLRLQPWLPVVVARRSMLRADFAALVNRATPWLERAERLLRPRWILFPNYGAEAVIGALCLIQSLTLLMPIPFGNGLPALTICIFALGLLERDGLWVLAGIAGFLVTMAVVGGLAYGAAKALIFVLGGAFG